MGRSSVGSVIVYAETNFVVELALGQEQCDSCRQIVEWAKELRIVLRIPVYALHEAQTALRRKVKDDAGLPLVKSIEQQIREFRRMRPFSQRVEALEAALTALSDVNERKIALLEAVIDDLASTVRYIPLIHDAIDLVRVFRGMKVLAGEGDLLIFASVMSELIERQRSGDNAPSLFLTRNTRDFTDHARDLLAQYSCDLFTSYDAAVGRLRSELTP